MGIIVKLIKIIFLLFNNKLNISVYTNFTFKLIIAIAAIHESIFCQFGITNSPILFLSLTK